MPHNKLIEEKVAAFAAFQLGTFENGLHVPITREQQDEWLHTALADLLATRDAQMIEAVETLEIHPDITEYVDAVKKGRFSLAPFDYGYDFGIKCFRRAAIAILRPKQQEEV